jgi:hypothetical protein
MTIKVTAVIDFFYLLDTPYEYILVRLENTYEESIVNLKTMQRWTSKIRNGKQILTINRGQANPDETKMLVIRTMIEENPHLSRKKIAQNLSLHRDIAMRN